MRFWLLHSGEVPIQDQIVAQVSLGVLSGELAPGERLPSVRELARRFHIHPNTVSLAYRRLQREGRLEARRGSGMYVRTPTAITAPSADHLVPLLASVVAAARQLGVTPAELRAGLDRALEDRTPASLLLLDPDPALQRIVLAELRAALTLPLAAHTYPGPDCTLPALPPHILPLVLPSKAESLRAELPAGTPLHVLRVRSVPQSLAPWLSAPRDSLVAIASAWPPFLDFARTMLIAAGFHADALLLRNPAEPGWLHGLDQAAAVVCDLHTATLLPGRLKSIPFPLLADDTLRDLQNLTRAAIVP